MKLAANGGGALFDRLQEASLTLARGADGAGKPLNLNNATLAKIVERRPRSVDEFAAISGVGTQKAERFGPVFLSIIAEEAG